MEGEVLEGDGREMVALKGGEEGEGWFGWGKGDVLEILGNLVW